MVKIDLITGFLGSGKTTFLRKYASYLLEQGIRIGILENDFGAVNVDMMLLLDLEGDNCDLEMISGGCDADCHKRRFKTKLIAYGMNGLDRVLVEPSGIYDVDEFFDTLREEPLNQWYEIGSVIAIVDANLEQNLSEEAQYLLATQIANAGRVILSRSQYAFREEIAGTVSKLNDILIKHGCRRKLEEELVCKPWDVLTPEDFDEIAACGYVPADCTGSGINKENTFTSLYFMNVHMTEKELRLAIQNIFHDTACGRVLRIKGFMATESGTWNEINATGRQTVIKPIEAGQEILIVIGEALEEHVIRSYFPGEV
ncbi:MAG: GTP-binding protein [Eubacteriales bacterium]|nr:GTP-binding protein [Eubacteriales bacterium]